MPLPFPRTALCALAVMACALALPSQAQTVKVGLAMDLSGPFAVGGAEAKAGFAVAMKQLGGKLGGVPVEYVEADTAGNPEAARQVVERMLMRDKIDLFTGPVGSSVALAVAPPLFAAKVPYLSSNTGPSDLSGARCNPYFFGASYPNDAYHEAAGKFAGDKGFKKVALIAPSYPGGKDAITGFKRTYKGTVGDELYTKLGQLDYSAELAQIRASKPDALYFFLPGAMGVSFIKQFVGAGLSKDVALISTAFSADEDMIPAVGEPMLGLFNTAHWSFDLDNPANQRFVAAFRQQNNGRNPSFYAGTGVRRAHGHGRGGARRGRQGGRQARAAEGDQGGQLQVGARRLPLRGQQLSHPELLPARDRQGRQRAHRQQGDRHGAAELPGQLGRAVRDEVLSGRRAQWLAAGRREAFARCPAAGARSARGSTPRSG
jgi:branched-chain amino acid transport system substrate-binding protein